MLKKILTLPLAFALLATPALAAPDQYNFDKDHTHVYFLISHLGFSHMLGRVQDFTGHFTFDPNDAKDATLDVTLKADSVTTDVPKLDNELKDAKFFNVAGFPSMHFKSTRVTVTGPNTGDVTGDFTMLGVTKPVTLHVIYNKSGIHPMTHNFVSGFSADGVLKRSDFGMNAYIPMVGDEVRFHIEAEGVDPLKQSGATDTPH